MQSFVVVQQWKYPKKLPFVPRGLERLENQYQNEPALLSAYLI